MARHLDADPRGRAWALLLSAQARLVERAERALADAGLPPLTWYDVLWALEKAEGGRLRMSELADRVVLARWNLTRLADRLEDAKLIAREPCPDDRRGAFCVVTPAGIAQRRAMWPVYRAAIERDFSSQLSDAEATTLATVLERLARAARSGPRDGAGRRRKR